MMTKSKWSAAALLIAVFALGALSGGAAVGLTERSTGEGRPQRGGMVEHMTQQLDLTAQQQDSVRAILERYKETFHAMRTQIGEEIKAMLTPLQLEQYEEMMTNYRGRRAHSGQGRGKRGRGPQ